MRLGLVVVVAAALIGITSPAVSAAPVSINLCAVPGTVSLGPVTVPIWGFGTPTTPGNCATATPQLPGPTIVVNEGDTVTITVINALPAAAAPVHTIQLEIPGITFTATSAPSADVGGTASISFTASAPGTYLYQSGGDAGRQEAMGLSGALIVRSLTAKQAYDTATTAYDDEATLFLGQVDPAFNANPDTFNMNNYQATYWLINGKAYPSTTPIPAPSGARRLMLRYVNAGYDNTTMLVLGMHERVLARDARLLGNPYDADAETLPAGGTEDAIVTVPTTGAPVAAGFPLYNRQLHVTNGAPATYPGGMLTFIQP